MSRLAQRVIKTTITRQSRVRWESAAKMLVDVESIDDTRPVEFIGPPTSTAQ